MFEATELIVAVKNIDTPDERHAFEHASLNVVNLPASRSPALCISPAGAQHRPAEGLTMGAVEPGDELAGGLP